MRPCFIEGGSRQDANCKKGEGESYAFEILEILNKLYILVNTICQERASEKFKATR